MSNTIFDNLQKTPIIQLQYFEQKGLTVYGKLEYYNPTGSIKDRAAKYIIDKLEQTREINKETTIIESSSGNFGIALSAYCKYKGYNFVCVIDPKINFMTEVAISKMASKVIKVDNKDDNGGYLLERLRVVNEIVYQDENVYWINQYGNKLNREAYYNTIGNEIIEQIPNVKYVFVAVSSGGTIAGISTRIKEYNSNIKIIAVDVQGSVVFGQEPKDRIISGLGSSIRPQNLDYSQIDEVVIVSTEEIIEACNRLLESDYIMVGGSSGAIVAAIDKYKENNNIIDKEILAIFPDKGDRYGSVIFGKE